MKEILDEVILGNGFIAIASEVNHLFKVFVELHAASVDFGLEDNVVRGFLVFAIHGFGVEAASVDFNLSHGEVLPVPVGTDYFQFEKSYHLIDRPEVLFASDVLSLGLHKFEPILFALVPSIKRKCAVDNKFVDGRGIILVAFDDYLLDAYLLLEGDYDLDGQSRVSVHIPIVVFLQDRLRGSDTLGGNTQNHSASIDTGKVLVVLDSTINVAILKQNILPHFG